MGFRFLTGRRVRDGKQVSCRCLEACARHRHMCAVSGGNVLADFDDVRGPSNEKGDCCPDWGGDLCTPRRRCPPARLRPGHLSDGCPTLYFGRYNSGFCFTAQLGNTLPSDWSDTPTRRRVREETLRLRRPAITDSLAHALHVRLPPRPGCALAVVCLSISLSISLCLSVCLPVSLSLSGVDGPVRRRPLGGRLRGAHVPYARPDHRLPRHRSAPGGGKESWHGGVPAKPPAGACSLVATYVTILYR